VFDDVTAHPPKGDIVPTPIPPEGPPPSALFQHISAHEGTGSWGAVLDAGTGDHSLRWLTGRPTSRWTAVTAEEGVALRLRGALGSRVRAGDRLVVGQWTDDALLRGEVYDLVLADYLLGAIDGFAPYFQDQLFQRLRPHVGGRLWATGLAPWLGPASTDREQLVLDVVRFRDACILHAGDRCYREYPSEWVTRHLLAAGFVVDEVARFPIVLSARALVRQIDVGRQKLPRLDPLLAAALRARAEALEALALALAPIHFGHDWVIRATVRTQTPART
jgi:hypothetical protein